MLLFVLDKKTPILDCIGDNQLILVQPMRLELTREFPYAPQTYASTSSAKAACLLIINKHTKKYNN